MTPVPIRKAKPADLTAIVALGIEALEKTNHPGVVISRAKVEDIARQCVTSSANFAWVAERDGIVGGAVCARVHECLHYAQKQASVVQFYSKIPGEGVKLIREFLRWARGRPAIKMIVFTLEADADPRIEKLLARLGLQKKLPIFLQTK
jgi:hypothetical protein